MTIEEIEAPHGDKTVEITIRFWTDQIAEEKGKLLPKHINNSGVIRMSTNKTHGNPQRGTNAVQLHHRIAGQDRRTVRAPQNRRSLLNCAPLKSERPFTLPCCGLKSNLTI
jgi:hypothetical protein